MLEPVAIQSILLATMAGALTVLLGAIYAFLFACSRLYRRPRLMVLAYMSFLLMTAAVAVLAWTLHLSGFWGWLVAAMLVGYLFAPHAIWQLCVGTHEIEQEDIPALLERRVEP